MPALGLSCPGAVHPSREAVERVFKQERGRILATLIRILGDIDLGEEALAAALEAALVQWPSEGTPANPRAWLIRAARNKAVDRMRRRALFEDKRAEMEAEAALGTRGRGARRDDEVSVRDDRLRLIFTCCHPALAVEAQVALTLRTLCGLETEAIARAFLVPAPTMAQRLVRAKAKIRAGAHSVPRARRRGSSGAARRRAGGRLPRVQRRLRGQLGRRADPARAVRGGDPARRGCSSSCCPARREARALLALMLLTDARRDARVDAAGEMVLLEEQDRSRWDRGEIREGLALVEAALRAGPPGAYALQAAIAGVHARAARAEETDWREIAALYAVLRTAHPSGVVALNHAAAVAMAEGPAAGLRLMDALAADGGARRLPPAAGGARRSSAPPRAAARGGRRVPRGARARRQRDRSPLPRAPARAGLARARLIRRRARRRAPARRRRTTSRDGKVPTEPAHAPALSLQARRPFHMQPHDSSRSRFPRPQSSLPPEVDPGGAAPAHAGLAPELPFAQSRVVIAAPALLDRGALPRRSAGEPPAARGRDALLHGRRGAWRRRAGEPGVLAGVAASLEPGGHVLVEPVAGRLRDQPGARDARRAADARAGAAAAPRLRARRGAARAAAGRACLRVTCGEVAFDLYAAEPAAAVAAAAVRRGSGATAAATRSASALTFLALLLIVRAIPEDPQSPVAGQPRAPPAGSRRR